MPRRLDSSIQPEYFFAIRPSAPHFAKLVSWQDM